MAPKKEKSMKKLTLSTLAAALAIAAAPAMAGQPDGSFVFKSNNGADAAHTIDNQIGNLSSRIIQNGQFVSGNCGCGIDQTTSPGSRADIVQSLLGH
jgi:hypothetical protein